MGNSKNEMHVQLDDMQNKLKKAENANQFVREEIELLNDQIDTLSIEIIDLTNLIERHEINNIDNNNNNNVNHKDLDLNYHKNNNGNNDQVSELTNKFEQQLQNAQTKIDQFQRDQKSFNQSIDKLNLEISTFQSDIEKTEKRKVKEIELLEKEAKSRTALQNDLNTKIKDYEFIFSEIYSQIPHLRSLNPLSSLFNNNNNSNKGSSNNVFNNNNNNNNNNKNDKNEEWIDVNKLSGTLIEMSRPALLGKVLEAVEICVKVTFLLYFYLLSIIRKYYLKYIKENND